ncbi:hypothetical protein BC939DRAFT_299103 [Gamsiella multidivaricata]|uniref:uncharacterized protein n=1 Tax=Gamsiella multidivaricata TaxID=101098 RepID=UPI00221FCF15|nr:uncharacterized protein BC939DRAFT_299103 [Gamsiella multidivaricata]KAI7818255.1 hypothetical protein BC939DRAFT_299103 [Gamsiella multidivaricata]
MSGYFPQDQLQPKSPTHWSYSNPYAPPSMMPKHEEEPSSVISPQRLLPENLMPKQSATVNEISSLQQQQ